MKLRTVVVNRAGIPVTINETSFNPSRDRLWINYDGEKEVAEMSPDEGSEADAPETVTEIPVEAHIVSHPGGWYTVEVNGQSVTDTKVRKAEAEAIAAEY